MPCFNESEGIVGFVQELLSTTIDFEVKVIIVDDSSTDGTLQVLQNAFSDCESVLLRSNEVNLGHGPTFSKALVEGLEQGADFVVSVDGDGQFYGTDICNLITSASNGDWDIVEGTRKYRTEHFYRRVTTLVTKLLVFTRSKKFPRDANTPLRVYRHTVLSEIMRTIGQESLIPNLKISALSRTRNYRIMELNVTSIPRRGSNPEGTNFSGSALSRFRGAKAIPSVKFVRFCKSATAEWFRAGL